MLTLSGFSIIAMTSLFMSIDVVLIKSYGGRVVNLCDGNSGVEKLKGEIDSERASKKNLLLIPFCSILFFCLFSSLFMALGIFKNKDADANHSYNEVIEEAEENTAIGGSTYSNISNADEVSNSVSVDQTPNENNIASQPEINETASKNISSAQEEAMNFFYKGQELYSQGRLDEALSEYKKGASIDPNNDIFSNIKN